MCVPNTEPSSSLLAPPALVRARYVIVDAHPCSYAVSAIPRSRVPRSSAIRRPEAYVHPVDVCGVIGRIASTSIRLSAKGLMLL